MKSEVPLLVLTLLMQWLTGLFAVGATGYRAQRSVLLPMSLLLGMFLHSLSMFIAQMAGVPLSLQTMMVSGIAAMLVPLLRWNVVRGSLAGLFMMPRFRPTLYDVVIFGFIGYVAYMVVWASWYWPVTPFDAMAGIDLVARYAARDGMIASQVFTDPSLQGNLSNQPFYAPFAMLMQVMMKLVGYPYTQIWVSIVAICFWWFTWATLRRLAHPLIAGLLTVLFILTPEMLGYSYILQTDFANAAFFAIGCVMLMRSIDEKEFAGTIVSAIAFAGACWSRTETPLLVGLVGAAALPQILRIFGPVKGLAGALGVLAMSTLTFALWNIVFFNAYLPVRPSTADQLRSFDLSLFAQVVSTSWTSVISSTELWGWIIWLFIAVIVIDTLLNRRLAQPLLIGFVVVTFLGLFLVGTIFSAAVVEQTLRRGMFKIIPLMVVAIAGSGMVSSASTALYSWEAGRKS